MADKAEGSESFGSGFGGFPKHLPDDTVEYFVFVIDPRLSQKQVLARLEIIKKDALQLTEELLAGYIWQRDQFGLQTGFQDQSIYLRGLTNFGDSVDDEWLVVFILREISKRHDDVWIRVADTDGEFLLIEAANTLPHWLSPDIAENRVWIHDNHLQIIPLQPPSDKNNESSTKETFTRPLSLPEAIKLLSKHPNSLLYSPLIEKESFYRLGHYPSQISQSMHYAKVILPRKLAYILHKCPGTIAAAVESFYLRDPIALRSLQADFSRLVIKPSDLVTTSVKFTKVLFAQVKSQQFAPPPAWKQLILDAETLSLANSASKNDLVKLVTGMKVTAGFEMLLTDAKTEKSRSVREISIVLQEIDEDGYLPSDYDMKAWEDSAREDHEEWLNINFQDFEKELDGRAHDYVEPERESSSGSTKPPAFGDRKVQADLRNIVRRFGQFLEDEDAGPGGAEVDELNHDGSSSDSDSSSEFDEEISFDEKEFARMMREMMGLPKEQRDDGSMTAAEDNQTISDNSDQEEDVEGGEIARVMASMEAELNELGALDLGSPSRKSTLASQPHYKNPKDEDTNPEGSSKRTSKNSEDIDIDFNLAQNLLDSFKSQAGKAGPAGNILGMMGFQLPRDEGDSCEPGMQSQMPHD